MIDPLLSIIVPGVPGWMESATLLVLGILLFGDRLPLISRVLGRSYWEVRKGVDRAKAELDSLTTLVGGQTDDPKKKKKDPSG